MPFSRSRSIESMTRSSTCWCSWKMPLCHSKASTRVVLPWSTWAMMAMLRMSSRVSTGIARPFLRVQGRMDVWGCQGLSRYGSKGKGRPPFRREAQATTLCRESQSTLLCSSRVKSGGPQDATINTLHSDAACRCCSWRRQARRGAEQSTIEGEAHVEEVAQWRKERHERLEQPRRLVQPGGVVLARGGENTCGSDPSSDVRLPDSASRGRLGVIRKSEGGVEIEVSPQAGVSIDGEARWREPGS